MMRRFAPALVLVAWLMMAASIDARAEDEFEKPPIRYSQSEPDNRITRLQGKLDAKDVTLAFTDEMGYLPGLLALLDVPVESQMLVFSKTSLQAHRISPRMPRAIYFNDEVYLGYCKSGDVLEVSVADPSLGAVFYTLDQRPTPTPRFDRQVERCIICHGSSRTQGVPGHIVRSLHVDPSGQPIYSGGSRTVDHTTPLDQRWGGWYVTGTHGAQTHQGNLIIRGREVPQRVDNAAGQNVTDLSDRFSASRYPSAQSDLIALMVFEHQTLVHNRLTQASFTARQALAYQVTMNRALGQPETTRLDSTTARIASAGDDLIKALLFVDEAELTEPVNGSTDYKNLFSAQGPQDSRGRSLRDFDLTRRMFKYPCSYLIYSEAFTKLPPVMKEYVGHRLGQILRGDDSSETYAHLSSDDRRAILEILQDTQPDLASLWHQTSRPTDRPFRSE